jgi:FdrA protein
MKHITIRPDSYYDSVFLMLISKELKEFKGVTQAIVTMGTAMNIELLDDLEFESDQLSGVGPNDLVIALEAQDKEVADQALTEALALINKKNNPVATAARGLPHAGSLASGMELSPDGNLAIISLPGQYAGREARKALDKGLHVMLFSDNVSLEEEIQLKQLAVSKGLLMMGPDCGTAIINGKPLCFANRVRQGSVGIVAASGTGLQEVACLIDRMGAGISQAVGTGGRDLKNAAVGGMTTLLALEALINDPATKVLVVISKPPAPEVAEKVMSALKNAGKPAVAFFLGMKTPLDHGNLCFGTNLEETALLAWAFASGANDRSEAEEMMRSHAPDLSAIKAQAKEEALKLAPSQASIKGLYTGGTLADEAMFLLQEQLGDIWSNNQVDPALIPKNPLTQQGHVIIDFGDDMFTRGKPHPMIEPQGRSDHILSITQDSQTAVLLMDFVLGHGSYPDPVGACLEPLAQAQEEAKVQGRHLCMIASVTGTTTDSQGLDGQIAKLRQAGVIVMQSNHQAALLALEIVRHQTQAR